MHEQTLTTLHAKNTITEEHLKEIRDALDRHTDMLHRICPQPVAQTEEIPRAAPLDTAVPSMSDNVVKGTIEDDLDSQITCVARSIIDARSTSGSIVGQTSPSGSTYSQCNCEDDEVRSETDQETEGQPSTDSGGVRLSMFGADTARRDLQNFARVPLVDHRGIHSLKNQAAPHSSSTNPQYFDAEFMNDLLDRYVSRAKKDLSACRFEEARDNLERALKQGKEREVAYSCPFEAELDIKISLANAYVGLEQFDLAERTLQPLLSIASPPKHTELCYTRALIHRERYRKTKDRTILDRLISLAEASYIVAMQPTNISKPFLTESAKILAESFQWKGDSVAAEAIRDRHPSIVSNPVSSGVAELAFERPPSLSGSISMEIDSSVGAPLSSDRSLSLMPLQCSTEQRSQAESSSTPPTSAGPVSHDLAAKSILLFQASQQGDEAMTKEYLNMGANIEHTDDDSGYTPLLVAAKSKHSGVCRLLVNGFAREDGSTVRADIDAKDNEGRNVLHLALLSGLRDDMISLFLANGADPNLEDVKRRTPLHYCAEFNRVPAAKKLLLKGAALEITDQPGETPLSLAIRRRQADLVEVLLKKGAIIDDNKLSDTSSDIRFMVEEHRIHLDGHPITRQVSSKTAKSSQTARTASSKSSWRVLSKLRD